MQQTGTVSRTTGRHIYAYCNLQTQQVVYSLKPSLHNASVRRQLPDTGANTSFVKLRKDLWHPLWSLSIPDGPYADAQGRHAFKKLREWRKLHETSWEPPPTLARPYSEKEIEKLQEEYDERGGKKKESVYDIIKRKKKYLRVNMVMDQRANSVADLAAVLLEQDKLGSKTAKEKEEEAAALIEAERSLMLELAEKSEQGRFKKIQGRIKELEELDAQAERPGEAEQSNRQLNRNMRRLTAHEKKVLFARDAVAEAKELLAKDIAVRAERARTQLKEKTKMSSNLILKQGLLDGSTQAELDAAKIEISRLEQHALMDEEATRQSAEYRDALKQLETLRDPKSQVAARYMAELELREKNAASATEATNIRRKLEAALAEVDSNPEVIATFEADFKQKNAGSEVTLEAQRKLGKLRLRTAQIEKAFENLPLLLEAEQGGVDRLEAAIRQLRQRQSSKDWLKATPFASSKLESEIKSLVQNRDHMAAVANEYEEQVAAAAEVPTLQAQLAELENPQNSPKGLEPGTEEYTTALKQLLPSFPKPPDTNLNLPKRGRIRAMLRERKRPTFASKGIKIKWRNPLDAEFAQEWPQDVEHLPMGLVRHTAPHVDTEAILDVASLRTAERNVSQLRKDAKEVSSGEQEALSGLQDTLARRVDEIIAEKKTAFEAKRAAAMARRAEKSEAARAAQEVRPPVPQSRRAGGESMSSSLDSIR